jgi:hypothetical protein
MGQKYGLKGFLCHFDLFFIPEQSLNYFTHVNNEFQIKTTPLVLRNFLHCHLLHIHHL